jgi:hypothetical protein
VEFHWPATLPYGGTLRGIETLQRRLETEPEKTWLGTWAPLQPSAQERRMDPRVVGSNGGEVVVLYRQRALRPGGDRLDDPVLGLYEVRDGKFARAQMSTTTPRRSSSSSSGLAEPPPRRRPDRRARPEQMASALPVPACRPVRGLAPRSDSFLTGARRSLREMPRAVAVLIPR